MRPVALITKGGAAAMAMVALFAAPATANTAAVLAAPMPVRASAPPHIGAVSPTGGRHMGGNIVEVRGHHLQAVTAVAFGSARSTKITHRSATQLAVAAPRHALGVVRVHLISSGGRSKSSVKYFYNTPPHLNISNATEIDPLRGELYDLSCPTEEFCAAVDSGSGSDGNSELVVLRAGQSELRTKAPWRVQLSCGTPSFCVAQAGSQTSFWNGTTWSPFQNVGDGNVALQWVSCAPGTTTCVGTDLSDSVVFHGSTSTSVPLPENAVLGPVSCTTPTFCVSVTPYGPDSFKFDGDGWQEIGPPAGLPSDGADDVAITCPTTTLCMAMDRQFFSRFNGNGWHKLASPSIVGNGPFCASATDCVMVGSSEPFVSFYSSTGFGPKQQVVGAHGGFVTGSCVPGGTCLAIDVQGQIFRHTASGWSADGSVPVTGEMKDISCPTVSWCMAVDARGNALQGAGSHWSASQQIDDFSALVAISCPSSNFCVAVDKANRALIFRAGTWSKPRLIDHFGQLATVLVGVDCTSARRCIAVDSTGGIVQWNGTRWSVPKKMGASFTGIDCPTAQMCLVTGSTPMVLRHGKWTKIELPRGDVYVDSPTCLRSDYCVTGGLRGFHIWHHGIWSLPIANTFRNSWATPVGCISDRMCIGSTDDDQAPYAASFAGDASRELPAFGIHPPTAISCVPNVQCVAVTDNEVRTMTPTS